MFGGRCCVSCRKKNAKEAELVGGAGEFDGREVRIEDPSDRIAEVLEAGIGRLLVCGVGIRAGEFALQFGVEDSFAVLEGVDFDDLDQGLQRFGGCLGVGIAASDLVDIDADDVFCADAGSDFLGRVPVGVFVEPVGDLLVVDDANAAGRELIGELPGEAFHESGLIDGPVVVGSAAAEDDDVVAAALESDIGALLEGRAGKGANRALEAASRCSAGGGRVIADEDQGDEGEPGCMVVSRHRRVLPLTVVGIDERGDLLRRVNL